MCQNVSLDFSESCFGEERMERDLQAESNNSGFLKKLEEAH